MLKLAAWVVLMIVNGGDNREPTDRLVPANWSGNPWGPTANRFRDEGKLPPIKMTADMLAWRSWGKTYLHEGDILFRRGDARVLFGYFPFSRFIANAAGSRYSHTGIIAIEKGEPFVYDMTKAGARKQPFSVWVLDNVGAFGVKRLKPAWRPKIKQVMNYCRDMYAHQVPFDFDLEIGDNRLYCVEMTENAFRSAGLKLSEPVALRDMERINEFPICTFAFSHLTKLKPAKRIYFPGNDRHGIWSSPLLETIYSPDPSSTSSHNVPSPPEAMQH